MRLALVMSLMMSARVPWDEMWDQGSERETEDAVKGWLPTSPPLPIASGWAKGGIGIGRCVDVSR